MSPLERAVVERKLGHLQELLTLLGEERSTPLASYLQDRRQQLQEFNSKPQTYAETFQLAGQHQLIPMELAQRLIPAAGLRNRLVHDYEAIDPSRVHAALPIALRDLSELAAAVADRVRI
jgi:hypothetical protein